MHEYPLAVITPDGLAGLITALRAQRFQVIAPTLRDQAIIYDEIETIADLPAGWTDVQDGGHYRVQRRQDAALFGYNVGPHAWKRFLHPPLVRLWRAERENGALKITDNAEPAARYAFLAVRSCELHAIAIQDRVFLEGPYVDPHYRARREGAFIIAANCGQAGGTCFCVSMHTGPKAAEGFDLALTELLDNEHRFLVEIGSERGAALLQLVPHRPVEEHDTAMAADAVARAEGNMGRRMRSDDVRELLQANLEHPRWDDVAERCLTCGNCTMVCPTCFCTAVEDENDLSGNVAERKRRWDSCFTMDFSYIHGGSVRSSARSRYRQWMTHKLASWADQFGTSGCVGCGRCITWCPVGIDITEEVRAIRGEGGSDGRA